MRRGARTRAGVAAIFFGCFLIGALPVSTADHPTSSFAATGQLDDPDTVQLDVTLEPNGDALWEIRYRVRLETENDTAAFESLERDIQSNRSAYASRFAERIDATVSVAENATGREMAVRNVSVETARQDIPQRYGALIYSFEWTGFATTDGPRLRAGDAIGGMYLDESTSLTIQWPSGYSVTSVDPSPDESNNESASWHGPADFTTEQPRLVVSSEVAQDGAGGSDPLPMEIAAVVLVALAFVVAGGWWWLRREPSATAPAADPTGTEPPEELLSNEERVLRLLDRNGGRMKQQQVVEELGWTDAKTSQVVSDLRDAGEVDAFRLGRENVLSLSDEEEPL